MMKKILSVFAAGLLLLSCAACAKSNADSAASTASSAAALQSGSSSDVSGGTQSQAESGGLSSRASAAISSSKAQEASSQSSVSESGGSSAPAERQTVRVTIPEGFTLSQIGDRLEAKGVCKKADLLNIAKTYNFNYYSLIGALGSDSHRAFKLEGYLFPNTYDFYVNMKPQDALGYMLRGSRDNIGSKYRYSGMTTDQIVTLASIIEKESGNVAEMKKISAVFHNRLKAGMKLQADVTINYVEKYLKPLLTGDINRYNSYYNTYKCKALPAGPICNPGANALYAAAHPQTTAVANTAASFGFTPDAVYFAADSKGNYYYATTLAQHKANLAKGGIIEGGGMTQ
jgi:UPF0755 protein